MIKFIILGFIIGAIVGYNVASAISYCRYYLSYSDADTEDIDYKHNKVWVKGKIKSFHYNEKNGVYFSVAIKDSLLGFDDIVSVIPKNIKYRE